jgi:Mrp family chromosome partitioning ATPase
VELSFLISAVRRYWWLPLATMVLFAFLATQVTGGGVEQYKSRALVSITPPSDAGAAISFNNNSDRYIAGQLSLITSESMADRVATQVGGGASAAAMKRLIVVAQLPASDVVEMAVITDDAEQSQRIVAAYVDQYFEVLTDQVKNQQKPGVDAIDAQIKAVESLLATANKEAEELLRPYRPEPGDAIGTLTVPTLDQLDPALATRRANLQSEFQELTTSRNQLDLSSNLQVTSNIVQRATLADAPEPQSRRLLLIAGALAGLALGLATAVVLARLSPRVLDEEQLEDTLGRPLAAAYPRFAQLGKSRSPILAPLPANVSGVVDSLCVRAESMARSHDALVVVVAGTERSAGTTTLAASMANRFAANGAQTLLVDVDVRHPELSRVFAIDTPGLPALLSARPSETSKTRQRNSVDPFASTSIPGLRLLGLGPKGDTTVIRRQNVGDIIDRTIEQAQVVVFDVGPAIETASSVEFAQLADALVLAVPFDRQRVDRLEELGDRLADRVDALLPVAMPAAARSSRRGASRGPKTSAEVVDVVEPVERELSV